MRTCNFLFAILLCRHHVTLFTTTKYFALHTKCAGWNKVIRQSKDIWTSRELWEVVEWWFFFICMTVECVLGTAYKFRARCHVRLLFCSFMTACILKKSLMVFFALFLYKILWMLCVLCFTHRETKKFSYLLTHNGQNCGSCVLVKKIKKNLNSYGLLLCYITD